MLTRVLLIDNYDSFTYNIKQLLVENGSCYFDIVKIDQLQSVSLENFDKIIISPGSGSPVDVPGLIEFIRICSSEKSILGLCLGHQAIAYAFGAGLINLKQVYHGLKRKIQILDRKDYLFENCEEFFEGGLYHSWAVNTDNFPEVLKITSFSEDGIIMSLTHKNLDIKGIQFHPESYMTITGKKIITNWIKHSIK